MIIANIGFALVFAALVAALFLGVLLAIEVWRYSPIAAAPCSSSALPLGMLVGRRCQAAPSRRRRRRWRGCCSPSGSSAWR